MLNSNKSYFLRAFAYAYAIILIYIVIAAFIYFLIAGPAVQALRALVFNYIIEMLPYLGAGIVCYYVGRAPDGANAGSTVALILIGVIVPVLPYNIPVLLSDKLFLLKLFLHAHIIFAVIGGFSLLHSLKREKQEAT